MMKPCPKYGTMSRCKEEFYEDGDEELCYYHRKVRDGLIVNSNDDYVLGVPLVEGP